VAASDWVDGPVGDPLGWSLHWVDETTLCGTAFDAVAIEVDCHGTALFDTLAIAGIDCGDSLWLDSLDFGDPVCSIGPPSMVVAEPGVEHIALHWAPVDDPELLVYRVFRGTTPQPTSQVAIVSPPDTSWTDTNAAADTRYWYRLRSVSWDFVFSDWSMATLAERQPLPSLAPDSLHTYVSLA
jgi:hypothetical protein